MSLEQIINDFDGYAVRTSEGYVEFKVNMIEESEEYNRLSDQLYATVTDYDISAVRTHNVVEYGTIQSFVIRCWL